MLIRKPVNKKLLPIIITVFTCSALIFCVFSYVYFRLNGDGKYNTYGRLNSDIELNADSSTWPDFVNLKKEYVIKYPRELSLRQNTYAYSSEFYPDVSFNLTDNAYDMKIYAIVIKDENPNSLSDWVNKHSNTLSYGGDYFEKIESINQSMVGGLNAVNFIENKQWCFEGSCSKTQNYWVIVNKKNSILGLSCTSCPKNLNSIFDNMVNSFDTINGIANASSEDLNKYEFKSIKINYPKNWFIRDEGSALSLRSYDYKTFYSGTYDYGFDLRIGDCEYSSILECMQNQISGGKNKTQEELINEVGGLIEEINIPSLEGYICGKMDADSYNKRSNVFTAYIKSKDTQQIIWVWGDKSLYLGDFNINKRIADYYYPYFKLIITNIEF